MYFTPLSKTPILQKSLFFFGKNAVFLGWSPHKSIKNPCKNDIKKNIEKKTRKSNFGLHVGLYNPLKSLRKAMQNEACFAMLCKPPGHQRKSTGLGLCWASKWLGIWLGLLDLPLVALIIKVSSATWNAARMFEQMRRGIKKTVSGDSKINENSAPRTPKSVPKVASKR